MGNIVGLDPVLGPLADNGGGDSDACALLAGSPAIDAGDPLAIAGVGGGPCTTSAARRLGEFGPYRHRGVRTLEPPALPGDYNEDDVVDGADYVVWRDMRRRRRARVFRCGWGWRRHNRPRRLRIVAPHFGEKLPAGAASGASSLAFLQSAFEALDEAVMSPAAATTAVSAGINLDAAGRACLVVFDAEPARYNSLTRPREQSNFSSTTESADEDLSLLLAIDSVRRSIRQDSLVIDDCATDNQLLDAADLTDFFDERTLRSLSQTGDEHSNL